MRTCCPTLSLSPSSPQQTLCYVASGSWPLLHLSKVEKTKLLQPYPSVPPQSTLMHTHRWVSLEWAPTCPCVELLFIIHMSLASQSATIHNVKWRMARLQVDGGGSRRRINLPQAKKETSLKNTNVEKSLTGKCSCGWFDKNELNHWLILSIWVPSA